jgi:Flp pilus assembly protein TadG
MNRNQRGQAIVMVALIMVVLFGFVGLAMDGGRGYLDRRSLQASVDAASLAAAYNYMNTNDPGQAEQAATNQYANNQRLYTPPACNGYGTANVTCSFGDPTNQVLTIAMVSHSIAGVTFTATATHQIGVTVMQVVGVGSTMSIGATATALARRTGTYGAAIQTLSPASCNGTGNSLVFTGTSTTQVTGDIWSNGSIVDNGTAGGSDTGNVIDICPNMPPLALAAPNWTVSGTEGNGFNIPDPNYPMPPLNATPETWNSTSGSTELPGTYSADPKLGGGAGCYFMSGGVYDFNGGFSDNGGFVSNELRPPDEPQMVAAEQPSLTTTTAALSGSISSIPVASLALAIPGSASQQSSYVSVGGQSFVVSSAGAAASATPTSIPLKNPAQSVTGTIPSGSWVSVRAFNQFWDANVSSVDTSGCSAQFGLTPTSSDISDPPVNPQTWAVELTAVRWSPNGVASCSGPASPTCYRRESAPSMCKTVTVSTGQVFKVSVTGNTSPPDPGAQDFNVYLASSGSCQGPFGWVAQFTNSNNPGLTINGSVLSGWAINAAAPPDTTGAPPPDQEGMPLAPGLPNANPTPATPPHGDMANEKHCVDPTTGNDIACPGAWTPGAVVLFVPGPGSNQQCLSLQGGGDVYLFTGYQYQRVLIYEPGPEQSPPPNTCLNNVAGHGLTSLIGIVYVPAASVTIIGNSSYLATIAGGVIAWTATVKGNGGVSISADPTLRSWPSAVRLVQ